MSYNQGMLINRGIGPPSAILTQIDPDKQTRNTYFSNDKTREKDISTIQPYPDVFERKRPMMIVEPTYDQHIIKPAKRNVTHGRIPYIEFITSCDRNFELYPNSGNYQIKLKDTYTNVSSVTLFNGCIPNTFYKINSNNNVIYFQESSCDKLMAVIPEGDYTEEQLELEIAKRMNDVGESKYEVKISPITHKIKICSNLDGGDHIFRLLFNGGTEPHQYTTRPIYPHNSIGKILGFTPKNIQYAKGKVSITEGSNMIFGDSDTQFLTDFSEGDIFYIEGTCQKFKVESVIDDHTMKTCEESCSTDKCLKISKGCLTGQNVVNLCPLNCIVLDIMELHNIKSNVKGLDDSFAVIPLYPIKNNTSFIISQFNGDSPYVKYFNPPLARLDRMTIRFKDLDGNIVNFNGVDNLLGFKIKTINAPGAYDPGSLL